MIIRHCYYNSVINFLLLIFIYYFMLVYHIVYRFCQKTAATYLLHLTNSRYNFIILRSSWLNFLNVGCL